jgi:hypothetical protein
MYTMKMLHATLLIVGLATVNAQKEVTTPFWTGVAPERCLVQYDNGKPIQLLVYFGCHNSYLATNEN